MLRRIRVGLDPSETSRTAVEAACYYTCLLDATVIGLGVVDVHAIERVVGEFERACAEQGVRHESSIRTGKPADELLELGNGADLLVSGNRTFFEFATHAGPDDTIDCVLRTHGLPVLSLPRGVVPPFRRAVIACDASPSAIRALRNFVYQTWDRPFHPDVMLVRVDDDRGEGDRALDHPRRFLEACGFRVQIMVEPGPVASRLREIIAAEPPSLLVLGSRGRWAPLDALFGSTTRGFLEDGTIPLLIAA
jgi:nucleotide-binding universal stress UspA family protein